MTYNVFGGTLNLAQPKSGVYCHGKSLRYIRHYHCRHSRVIFYDYFFSLTYRPGEPQPKPICRQK